MPITTLQPDRASMKDAYTNEATPTINYRNDKILVGDGDSTSSYRALTGYIHYPIIDTIMANGVFNKIKVLLYCEFVNADVYLYKVTGSWNETTVTHATQPTRESTHFLSFRPVVGWNEIDVTQVYNSGNCKGIAMRTLNGDSFSVRFLSSGHANQSLHPKLYVEYIQRPSIAFHDENGQYYSDDRGDIIKLLDFGTIIAGQTTLAKRVFVKNLTGESITNIRISIDKSSIPNHSNVEVSRTNNPFIAEPVVLINGTVVDGSSADFYVRIVSTELSTSGYNFVINAKSDFI